VGPEKMVISTLKGGIFCEGFRDKSNFFKKVIFRKGWTI
jgi:hypothetical protein